ncbi:hypothetical protein [Mycolicibacterium sp. 050158]|uniref:hypothetical protein n=1 Tax=Mycolicibacterium sp. 050158 TaxID=3090602 RepID=UPI00299EE87C|nr:hypothetical protein [Mycolicibacterium sp. 050158]MDX1891631.1 hypothetical protein [Mycolicibacterium sp. 050158]
MHQSKTFSASTTKEVTINTKIVKIPVLGDHLVNTYLLIGRRPVLVDCGMPSSGDRIWNGVIAAGVDPTDLESIIVKLHIGHGGPMPVANVRHWLSQQLAQRNSRRQRRARQ